MLIFKAPDIEIGWQAGRIGFPGYSLTLLVKQTLAIGADGSLTPLDEQPPCTGDVIYEGEEPDDPALPPPPRYPSDFALAKPRAEVMLVGSCYAEGGGATPATYAKFTLGSLSRSIIVTGDRYWKSGAFSRQITDPEPFAAMPLKWQNAFGGKGFKPNPVGKGTTPIDHPDLGSVIPVPNLELPEDRIKGPGGKHEPACMAPVPADWPPRAGKLGTYRRDYVKTRWPAMAEDMDPTFFNAAPLALQLPQGYFRGDETLTLENLHPAAPKVSVSLPGKRMRIFLRDTGKQNGQGLREATLNLDTVHIDTDAAHLTLVWRGLTSILDEYFDEISHIMAFAEPLNESKSLAECRAIFDAAERAYWADDEDEAKPGAAAPPAAPEDEMGEGPSQDELEAEAWAEEQNQKLRESVIAAGLDPDNLPEPTEEEQKQGEEIIKKAQREQLARAGYPEDYFEQLEAEEAKNAEQPEEPEPTAQDIEDRARAGESLSGEDLREFDLSGLDLSGADLSKCILSGCAMHKTTLTNANLTAAVASSADLTGADLAGANLSEADFTSATFDACVLSGASIGDTQFDAASMSGAVLDGATGEDASFIGASLDGATFVGCDLAYAQFTGADLREADFTEASLEYANLENVNAESATFERANLTNVRAAGDGNFKGAILRESTAPESVWSGAVFDGANISFANFTDANFEKCSLAGTDLTASRLRWARFLKANLTEALLVRADALECKLEKADLTRADLSGANLYGAEFLDAKLDEVYGHLANLDMTKLAGRRLPQRGG